VTALCGRQTALATERRSSQAERAGQGAPLEPDAMAQDGGDTGSDHASDRHRRALVSRRGVFARPSRRDLGQLAQAPLAGRGGTDGADAGGASAPREGIALKTAALDLRVEPDLIERIDRWRTGVEPTDADLRRMDLIQRELDEWRGKLSERIDPAKGNA